MDFRFQDVFHKLMQSLDFHDGDYDMVSIAGGAGNFEQLKKHLKLSTGLHQAENIVLTVHEDCGAGATKDDLLKALRETKQAYPNRTVQAYYVYLDGTWEGIKDE